MRQRTTRFAGHIMLGAGLLLSQPMFEGCQMAGAQQVPTRVEDGAAQYRAIVGEMLRRQYGGNPTVTDDYVSSYVTERNPTIKSAMLDVAKACYRLGMSYNDMLSLKLSFSDPYRQMDLRVPIKKNDPEALSLLRTAIERGMAAQSASNEAGITLSLDRFSVSGTTLSVSYHFNNVEEKKPLPR